MVTLSELCKKMNDYEVQPYSLKHMRRKLINKFGKDIQVTNESGGKPNFVILRANTQQQKDEAEDNSQLKQREQASFV